MLYSFLKKLALVVVYTSALEDQSNGKIEDPDTSKDEPDQEDGIPKEWLERVNVVMTPDIPAVKGVMLAANRAIQINAVGIDDTGIFYTSKGERWFDFLMNIAKIAKWQVRISKGGFLIKPDTPENSYWQPYAVPLPPGKRTSWAQTGDATGTTKAEFNKDIWAEIILMFSNWEKSGAIKSFLPMSQGSIICVDATQAMHREITGIIRNMIKNMNTKISLELQIVELDLKPGASVPNEISYGRQPEEKNGKGVHISRRDPSDEEEPPESPVQQAADDMNWAQYAIQSFCAFFNSPPPTSVTEGMGKLVTNIASGITLLKHYGKVKTVFKWKGDFNHNDAFTAGSIETRTAFIKDSQTEFLSDKKSGTFASASSLNKQVLPIGVTMHVVGTADEGDNITLSMQFEMTEAGKVIELPNRECVVAGDVPESIKHNFTTVVSMQDGQMRIIGGLKIIKGRHGSFGLKRGIPFWRGKAAEERELQILVKASIVRHEPVPAKRSLDYYELHPLEDSGSD